jgi:RimJ/RimL family protein N-acetyltransferase
MSTPVAAATTSICEAVDASTGEVVGHCELQVDHDNRLGRVVRVLMAPQRRGTGIGTAITGDLRIAFDELGLHRLSLRLYDFNDSAIACYERQLSD